MAEEESKNILALKIRINSTHLTGASIGYLYLPLVIFFIAWTKWWIAGIAISALAYGAFVIIRDSRNEEKKQVTDCSVVIGIIPFALIAFCLLFIGIVSGWGGWMPQSSDWAKHNALLNDLIHYDWPVYYTKAKNPSMLTYYLGQYIIPAAVGKLAGSFRVAEIVMFIWGEVGLFLIAFHLFKILNASSWIKQISAIVILLLFSGCLIISQRLFGLISGFNFYDTQWMVRSRYCLLQYRSNYVDMRWVMPQCIAVWLIVSMWWNNSRKVFYYVPLMLPAVVYGALSFLGLAVMAILCAVYEAILERKPFLSFVKQIFSLPNVVTIIAVGLPLILYYSGNVFSEKDPAVDFSVQYFDLWLYLAFCLGHFGLYAVLVWKQNWKKGIFIGAVILLLALPFFKMGYFNDLVMSTSIPALFAIMICVTGTLFEKPKSVVALLLIVCLIIGAINPSIEMNSVILTNHYGALDNEVSVKSLIEFSDVESGAISWKYNYFSYNPDDNFFIQYLARKTWE